MKVSEGREAQYREVTVNIVHAFATPELMEKTENTIRIATISPLDISYLQMLLVFIFYRSDFIIIEESEHKVSIGAFFSVVLVLFWY